MSIFCQQMDNGASVLAQCTDMHRSRIWRQTPSLQELSTYAQPLHPDDLGYRSSLSGCERNYLLDHVPYSLCEQYKNRIISVLLCLVKDFRSLADAKQPCVHDHIQKR